MDVDFSLSQMDEYTRYADSTAEFVVANHHDFQTLFAEGYACAEELHTRAHNQKQNIRVELEHAEHVKEQIKKKISEIPPNKEPLPYPPSPGDNDEAKEMYEKARKEIDKANAEIAKQNEENNQKRDTLNSCLSQVEDIIARLNGLMSRCEGCQTRIENERSAFAGKVESSRADMERAVQVVNQTVYALGITLSQATPLTFCKDTDRVNGFGLGQMLKLKFSPPLSFGGGFSAGSSRKASRVMEKETTENEAGRVKCTLIKSRKREEFFATIDGLDTSRGERVKIPSHTLFALGNKQLFEDMKTRGFILIENKGQTVQADGTIMWEKV